MTEEIQSKGISRRTVVQGAAWSVPVVAAAATVPMASASPTDNWDVGVTADCVGNYDLSNLIGLIEDIPLAGPAVAGTVQGLLGAVGLQPFESRGFTITAVEGDVPAGTQFTFAQDAGLINLDLLAGAIDANVLGLVTIGDGAATLELPNGLAEGQSTSISLQDAAVELGVGGNASLSLVGEDNPIGEGAPNSVSQNYVTVETNLNNLIDVSEIPVVGAVVGLLTITVQLCPGQSNPAD